MQSTLLTFRGQKIPHAGPLSFNRIFRGPSSSYRASSSSKDERAHGKLFDCIISLRVWTFGLRIAAVNDSPAMSHMVVNYITTHKRRPYTPFTEKTGKVSPSVA